MTVREVDYHYLMTSAPRGEPRRYRSAEEARGAIESLLHLQGDRGFTTIRDGVGRYESRHPDGRTIRFWIQNARGDVVT